MPISFTASAISNTTQLVGNQTEVRTAGLANGGYVVAWQSTSGSPTNVFFQRYDAAGVQVGALTQITNPASANMFLRDIAVAADGTFSILTEGAIGVNLGDLRLFVSSFFGTTGGPSGPQALVNLTAFSPFGISGAQLVPGSSASSMVVLASVPDSVSGQDLIRAVVTTAGVVSSAPVLVTNAYAGTGIIEAVESIGPQQFVIGDGTIIDTLGSFATLTSSLDVTAIAPGSVVVARPSSGNPQVNLTLLFGNTASVPGLGTSGGVVGTSVQGVTTSGTQGFDIELVDLGAGRILVVWVADGGDTVPGGSALVDGVYAQVYNMNTGGPEGNASLIQSFGVGSNDAALQGIVLSADLMEDGRVVVGLSYSNGLSGFDVFSTVLDARIAGITVMLSAVVAETFVGTAFDDTFGNVTADDQILGGSGSDTVAFGSSAARSVDLQTPGAFPANRFVLSGIENLTGNTGADQFRGDAADNALSGLAGNDTLSGRNGNDRLTGGTDDDVLSGGNGADVLDAGAGIDTLDGDADDDLLFGGADADRMLGGTGNDTLYGGDSNDRLLGEAGDDDLFGEGDDDVLGGGAGDDTLTGGAGADTLRAEDGADVIFGGADNDTIFAHAGVGLIDGGTGTDTLRVSGPLGVNTAGVHVDLTGVFDLLDLVAPLTRFAEEISGIENVTGTTGNDFITGDGLVNSLRGGAGNDTLVSGAGADILFGNAGADVFVFTSATGGADQLRDYAIGTDRIGLMDGAFGDINAFNIGSRLAINATGTVGATALAQLIFDNSGVGFGQLFFDADGNGAGTAVLLATLTPTTGTAVAISAAEFLFL